MVKEYLSQRGIPFVERDVSLDPAAAQEVVSRTGQMGVPVTVIDGETVVGFDRVRLEELLAESARPSLGASVADASKITSGLGSRLIVGAYVGRVRPDSPAQRMGLAVGDVVVEVNMRRIATAADLEDAVSRLSVGSRVSLVYLRGNQELTTEGSL